MENNTPARKLKELPKLPKKGKIYEMYGKQFSNNTMKINLNALIEDFKTRSQMHVSTREVPKPGIKSFGFPENYEPDFELENQKTVFDK